MCCMYATNVKPTSNDDEANDDGAYDVIDMKRNRILWMKSFHAVCAHAHSHIATRHIDFLKYLKNTCNEHLIFAYM